MVSLLEYSVLVPGDVCQVCVGSGVAKLREEGQQVQTISEVTGVGGGRGQRPLVMFSREPMPGVLGVSWLKMTAGPPGLGAQNSTYIHTPG